MTSLKRIVNQHPNLIMWLLLALGMVAMVLYASKDVGFQPLQQLVLIIATVVLAGLCVWIINWE